MCSVMMDPCTKCYNLATKITLIGDFPEKKCLPLCLFVKYPYLCSRKEQKDAG